MSYILQALRRSEQAQRSPGAAPPVVLAETADEPRRIVSWLVLALALFLLAGAGGYYAYGLRTGVATPATPTLTKKPAAPPAKPTETPPPSAATPSASAQGGAEQAPATGEAPPALEPSPFAEPPKRGEVRDLAEQLRVPPPRVAKAPPPPRPAPEAIHAAPPPAPPPVARMDDGVKFLRAMPPEFQRELPALVVNIHIYAANEADRILYINNRQYQAGDKVREDIRVEAIVEDGAVLSYRGQRFKLPRPS